MTNNEKLEKLKEWLKDNNIPFEENHKSRSTGFTFDLRVKKPLIAVCISSEKDNEIFHRIKRTYAPFFIRESETAEFIIEKMQNCIVERMMQEQRWLEKKTTREANKTAAAVVEQKSKRKRVRIARYEKVEYKHK